MTKPVVINDLMVLDKELAIIWNDNTESYISFKILRDYCPCAFCSGEKDVLGNVYKGPKQTLGETAYQFIKYEPVGHYALRIFWKDMHADGLYTFEMLQKLGKL